MLGMIEAMKMELSLKAPFAGTVTTVGADKGEQVALGDTLFEVEPVVEAHDAELPGQSPSTRSARATGCRTRRRWCRTAERQFVRRLLAAGLPVVEATSFVHPKWVPQLADAGDLMTPDGPTRRVGRDCPVLVPNERGLDRALELGLRHIAIFGSATETFAQKNLNRSLDEQFAMFEPTVRRARDAGLDVRAYVSMCFGDPWEGEVPVEQVVGVGKRLFDLGASQLSLGDTIGVGTAGQVTTLVEAFVAAGMRPDQLALHFHDTYGQALANTYAGLQAGITTFDASAGGLGGCPYAKSATGNLATEDLVWLLTGLGIEHGVDLDALVATSAWMAGELGRPSPSAVVRALAHSRRDSGVQARLRAHRCAQDRHVVRPGPARPQHQRSPPRRPLPLAVADRAARFPVPGRARPARPGLGRHAGARGGLVGRVRPAGPPRPRLGDPQPRDPAPARAGYVATGSSATCAAPRSTSSTAPATWPARCRPPGRRASSRPASGPTGSSSQRMQDRDGPRGSTARSTCPSVLNAGAPACRPTQVHVVTVPRRGVAEPASCCGTGSARRSASTPRGRPSTASAPTARSAWPRPSCCAASTAASSGPGGRRGSTTT